MGNLADAFVSVLPDMRGFGPALDRSLGKLNPEPAGRKMGERTGKGMSEGLGGKVKEFSKGIMGPLLGLFAVDKAREFFAGAIEGASGTAEAQSKVGVVFGKAAGQIIAASDTSARAMGLSKEAYLDATGTLGNLFIALKLPPKAAADMSQKMVGLAGDLASFNNVRPEDALEALRAGLTGETEPLRKFGVNLNEAGIKAEALRLGLVKSTGDTDKIRAAQIRAEAAQVAYTKAVKEHGAKSEEAHKAMNGVELANIALGKAVKGTVPQLTAAQKAQASYSLIMQQTKTAQGDFARTSGGLANSQRILSAEFTDLKNRIGAQLLPVVTGFVHVLSNNLVPAIGAVGSGLGKVTGFMSEHKAATAGVLGVIGALVAAERIQAATLAVQGAGSMLKWIAATKGGTLATQAFTYAAKLMDLAMSTSTIGIVVKVLAALVIGLVVAYKTSATFRGIVQGAWAGIQSAASAAWGVIRPVLAGFGSFITGTVIPAIRSFWTGVAVPAFRGIGAGAGAMWNIIRPVLSALNSFVRTVIGPSIMWWWNNVTKPALGGIATLFRVEWAVIGAVIRAFNTIIRSVIGPSLSWLWNNVARPAMAGISAAVRGAWGLISPVLGALNTFIRKVIGPTIAWWWNNIVKPELAFISGAFRVAWSIIKPTLQLLNDIIRKVVSVTVKWFYTSVVKPVMGWISAAVKTMWTAVHGTFTTLNTYVRNTLKATIQWLYNNVVKPTMNSIQSAVSTMWTKVKSVFSAISTYIHTTAVNTWKYLWNNVIGHYMGNIATSVSNIWNRNVKPIFNVMKDFISKTVAPGFSRGVSAISTAWGKVRDAAKAPVNFIIGTVYGRGIKGLFDRVASAVGSKARLPSFSLLAKGGPVPLVRGARRDRDSVPAILQPGEFVVRQDGSNIAEALSHFGAPGYIGGGWVGGIVSKIGGLLGKGKDAVVSAAGSVTGWIGGLLGKMAGPVVKGIQSMLGGVGGSPLGGLLKSTTGYLLKRLVEWIGGKDKAAPAGGGGAYTGPIPGGGNVTRWSATVLKALSLLHQSPGWLATVLRRLNQESGGNPNAINLTDINAQNGVPSQGLMQVIPPTFAAYAGPFRSLGLRNPLANIYAGLNYAIHRYGSLSALNRPGGYDTGGILNPGQIGANYGRRPERVLSAQQTEAFDRLVAMLDSGSVGSGVNVNVTNHNPVAEPTSVSVARALQFTAALGR